MSLTAEIFLQFWFYWVDNWKALLKSMVAKILKKIAKILKKIAKSALLSSTVCVSL